MHELSTREVKRKATPSGTLLTTGDGQGEGDIGGGDIGKKVRRDCFKED